MSPLKRLLLIFWFPALLAWSLSGYCGVSDSTPLGEPNLRVGRIQLDERVYDFGFAGQGFEIVHEFVFRNTGEGILRVHNVSTSCGCLAALSSGENIFPGGIGIIRAAFQTGKYEGKQKKSIYIESNDPAEPKAELAIQGVVKNAIVVTPQGLGFDNLPRGKIVSKMIKVLDLAKEGFQITRIEGKKDYFHVGIDRYQDKITQGFILAISLTPEIPSGVFNEIITVHTSSRKQPRIDIPVWGKVIGDFTAGPNSTFK
jgi:hypothetical protein